MQLQIFKFQDEDHFSNVRTIELMGEIWFVASDVAKVLGYSNPRDAISRHCKEKGVVKHDIPTASGVQSATLINEANIYRLIVKSQLPSAERFESWLFEEVVPSIRKKGYYGKIDRTVLPNFIERYKENYHKIPGDHFSVISEMYVRLHMALEKVGYVVPNKSIFGSDMMPDISVGRTFASYLKKVNSEFYNSHKTYPHTFPNGKEVEANMYHIDALPIFIKFINEIWIPQYAENYFKDKDPLALDYLPKLLGE